VHNHLPTSKPCECSEAATHCRTSTHPY
jgi:hypothetical protein